MPLNKILTIIGPTASGKTVLSVALAKKINGEIISLDSRQIYRNMAIGTNQPDASEKGEIPHHLFEIKDPDEKVTAGEYAKRVFAAVEDIQSREKRPIICGGAGLYFRAITKGIFEGSISDLEARKRLESEYDKKGPDGLLERLKSIDPEYAEIVHPNNKKRLVRALEIYEATGKSPSQHFLEQETNQSSKLNLFTIYLDWDRSILAERIEQRTQKMLNAGWIDEVKSLLIKYPNEHLHALDSIGYRQIISYLNGDISESGLENEIILRTRQFAVRQIKWFRNEKVDMNVEMSPGRSLEEVTKMILDKI